MQGNILVLSTDGFWLNPASSHPSGNSSWPSLKFPFYIFGVLRPHILSEFLVVLPWGRYEYLFFSGTTIWLMIAKDLYRPIQKVPLTCTLVQITWKEVICIIAAAVFCLLLFLPYKCIHELSICKPRKPRKVFKTQVKDYL